MSTATHPDTAASATPGGARDTRPGVTVTGPVTFVLPDGTMQEQARGLVRALQGMAVGQGWSADDWARVTV